MKAKVHETALAQTVSASAEGMLSSALSCFDSPRYAIFPGFCDVHVHFREPGFSYKETVRTGSLSAARGGYTAVCTMPNLNPVPDSVENLNIQGAYRCLGDSKDFPATGDVRIKNVTADGTTLALGLSKGSGQGTLYVDGCTLRGWVLHNKFKEATFTDCTFSWNSLGTGGDLRPYVYTELINCRFEGKTDENGKYTPYRINFYKNSKGVILVLENCYVGDTLITEQNINSLLTVKAKNNTIIVRNSST